MSPRRSVCSRIFILSIYNKIYPCGKSSHIDTYSYTIYIYTSKSNISIGMLKVPRRHAAHPSSKCQALQQPKKKTRT